MSRNRREGGYFGKVSGKHYRHAGRWDLRVIFIDYKGTVFKMGRDYA